jgi:alkylhydroperoxidase family enzyme
MIGAVGNVTWLDGGLAARPDLAERYDAMLAALWASGVEPRLLELCRLAIAGVLGDHEGWAVRTPVAALDDATVTALAHWRTDPGFTSDERAVLEVAEQFAIDVHGVTDAQFAALVEAVGPKGAVALTTGLGLFDGQSRMRLALRRTPEVAK